MNKTLMIVESARVLLLPFFRRIGEYISLDLYCVDDYDKPPIPKPTFRNIVHVTENQTIPTEVNK